MASLFKQWLHCLRHYVLMCLLASSPERLPYNIYCTLLSLFSYCLLGLFLIDEQRSYVMIFAQIMLETGLLALIIYLGLKWRDKLDRFQQSLSALIGVNLVISALSLPVYRLLTDALATENEVTVTLINATMLIVIWNLAVLSLIFKRTLDINSVVSAIIAFNYFVVYQLLTSLLY